MLMQLSCPAPGKLVCGGLLLAGLFLGTGCVTGWRAKAGVYDAFYDNQAGDNAAALAHIQAAVRKCAWPGVPLHVVIEAYDDAGLYYFLNHQPRASFVHQAVAVLLAETTRTPPHLLEAYYVRLARARAAAGIELTDDAIAENFRLLLTIPEVRDNPQVRRHYGSQGATR